MPLRNYTLTRRLATFRICPARRCRPYATISPFVESVHLSLSPTDNIRKLVSIGAIFGQRLPGPTNSQMVAVVTSKCPWLILIASIMGDQCRSPDINEIMHFLLLLLETFQHPLHITFHDMASDSSMSIDTLRSYQ